MLLLASEQEAVGSLRMPHRAQSMQYLRFLTPFLQDINCLAAFHFLSAGLSRKPFHGQRGPCRHDSSSTCPSKIHSLVCPGQQVCIYTGGPPCSGPVASGLGRTGHTSWLGRRLSVRQRAQRTAGSAEPEGLAAGPRPT